MGNNVKTTFDLPTHMLLEFPPNILAKSCNIQRRLACIKLKRHITVYPFPLV